MAFLFGLRTLLECLGKDDKGREERDHSSQELHELSEIGHGHHLPSDGGLCPARGLPTARTILSERLTPARLLPSHRACAKKRAAKQRELVAFVVSYNLNQQSQTHSATSAKQGINLFAIMIILQIATVLIIALTATNVLKYEFGFIASCLMAIAAGIAVSYTTPAKK